MSEHFYQQLDKANSEIIEINNKKLADRPPNTFSILYREGEQSSNIEYSDYFLEELTKRSDNLITDINDNNETDVRTSIYTHELYLERSLYKTRNETRDDFRQILAPERSDRKIRELTDRKNQLENELDLINNDIHQLNNEPYVCDNRDEYKLKMLENVPNYMKDSFTIINYPKWGEVIEFDYNKLKAEMLDEYMKTGSKDKLDESYKILLQDMEKFPNLYTIKNNRILETSQEMPYEIMEKERLQREYCRLLSQSPEFVEIRVKIYDLTQARPINNATREQIQAWEALVKELWDTIPEKYKTAFNMKVDSRGIHTFVFESL